MGTLAAGSGIVLVKGRSKSSSERECLSWVLKNESFPGPGVAERMILDREIASLNTEHHEIGGL